MKDPSIESTMIFLQKCEHFYQLEHKLISKTLDPEALIMNSAELIFS